MLRTVVRNIRRGDTGTALVLVALFMVVLMGFVALSIDVGNVLRHQRDEQSATDAGSFAGVTLVTNVPPATKDAIIAEAQAITVANGVTPAEIMASNFGTIQIGFWDTKTLRFTRDGSPTNAVLVPAKRNVPLFFGRVVGVESMNPSTYSIAGLMGLGCLTNVIPFGVTAVELTGKNFGDSLTLNSTDIGSGKLGAIYIRPSYGNGYSQQWYSDMVTLGTDDYVSCVGTNPVKTGIDSHVKDAFEQIANENPGGAEFTMLVVDSIDTSGRKPCVVVGFVYVRYSDYVPTGTGSGWRAKVTFLNHPETGPGGGSCPPPCTQTRVLLR
jgi:Flp pilus assembly protein TadG